MKTSDKKEKSNLSTSIFTFMLGANHVVPFAGKSIALILNIATNLKVPFTLTYLLIVLFACNNSSKTTLNENLILHLDFENSTKDKGANQLHAEPIGNIVYTNDAAVGKHAALFDGNRSFIQLPSNKTYFNGSYTICVWCKWDEAKQWSRVFDFNQSTPQSGNAVTLTIGRKETEANPLWFTQWITHKGNVIENILDFENRNPADADLLYNVKTQKWQHYALVYNADAENTLGIKTNAKQQEVPYSGRVDFYVDGEKVKSTFNCLKPQNMPTENNWLGRSAYPADPFFKGAMDDFRVYNRGLSPKEIAELFELKKE